MTLRIAYVIDSLGGGGTQTFLCRLYAGLAERGHLQHVLALNDDTDPAVAGALTDCGARVRVLGKARLAAGVGLWSLWRDVRDFAPDVVLTLRPWADALGRPLAALARPGRVLSSVRARGVDLGPLMRAALRLSAPLARRTVFNSAAVVDHAVRHEGVRPDRVVVIPNGTALPDPAPDCRKRLRRELGAAPDQPVIGTLGRLYPQKGHALLLQALALLRREGGPGARALLAVAGRGPLEEALRRQAGELGLEDAVRLTGHRRDVSDFLHGLDVYAHAALFEGQPNAVLEAMAAGLPVAATGVDGTAEIVEHGVSGLLVPPADPAALAGALARLLADRDVARAMGRAAAERVARDYSPEAMVAAWEALFRDVAREAGTAE